MASARDTSVYLIRGQVMHERLRPVWHRFVYPVFYVRLNVAAMGDMGNTWFGVDRKRLMSIRSRDYGPRDGSSLDRWMRAQLQQAGLPDDGDIWLQTFPRLFGFVFNPVSFWYCHDRDGQLRAVLAEVNNTFGDTHRYLLTAPDGGVITDDVRPTCAKAMHVSPFCEVRGAYRFRFRESENTVMTGIDYHDDAEGDPLMRTAVGGRLAPLTAGTALAALCRQPFMTFGIVANIHWQALLLWRKRVPWFSQPSPSSDAAQSSGKEI